MGYWGYFSPFRGPKKYPRKLGSMGYKPKKYSIYKSFFPLKKKPLESQVSGRFFGVFFLATHPNLHPGVGRNPGIFFEFSQCQEPFRAEVARSRGSFNAANLWCNQKLIVDKQDYSKWVCQIETHCVFSCFS